MSSLNLASLPPAGASISPSSGAPAESPRAPSADLSAPAETTAETKDERGFFDRMWGKDGFSFGALLDIVNPLQHIPVVGTVYRAITGDTIGPAARIAGGTLFGGVFGLIASSIDTAVKEETGQDIGQHVLALRDDGDVIRDPTTPTGRPERDGVLYAGDFSPRATDPTSNPGAAPTTMLAQAPAASLPQTAMAAATPPQIAGTAPSSSAPTAARVQAPQHEAANGAGGAPVPFSTTVNRAGRAASLPTPQSVAADPALLRQMQSARPQSTAIRASATMSDTAATRTFLDYTPKNAALRSLDAEQAPPDRPAAPSEKAAPIAAGTLPEVPADLISRMNMALEKYQAMQGVTNRPKVDVTQ